MTNPFGNLIDVIRMSLRCDKWYQSPPNNLCGVGTLSYNVSCDKEFKDLRGGAFPPVTPLDWALFSVESICFVVGVSCEGNKDQWLS